MTHTMAVKARNRRVQALLEMRMPQINIFWDGVTGPSGHHTVVTLMTDARVRMGPHRSTLAPEPPLAVRTAPCAALGNR